jgi:hypothetical protein
MEPDPHIDELEQALSNERAEREVAQRRAAKLAENAAVWRSRAEERAQRIDRLEAERDQLRSIGGWLRAKAGRAVRSPRPTDTLSQPIPASGTGRPAAVVGAYRAFPSTVVAAIGVEDPVLRAMLGQFNVEDYDSDPGVIDRADIVMWDPSTSGKLDAERHDRLRRWLDTGGRQPLVVLSDEPKPTARSASRRTLPVSREWTAGDVRDSAEWVIPTTFDADQWSPARRIDRSDLVMLDGVDSDILIGDVNRPVIRGEMDLSIPWMAAAAAAAIPFTSSAEMSPGSLARGGALARRAAYAERAPWIVASALMDQLGLWHAPPNPSVAGVLVSNRPERIADAVSQINRQTYPRFELIVGCHGFPAGDVRGVLDSVPDRLHLQVAEFDPGLSLGRCLNESIELSSSSVIAKIDDDDHYGPGYIEDAVQAMLYAGSPFVAKGAVLTYLESRDETYLRRPEIVERFYGGSPNGASMVFTRHLWEQVGFPDRTLGEDVAFSAGARLLGVEPYATSPWEFVYRRSVSGNTWGAVDEVFLEGSVLAWEGDDPQRADLASP